MKKTVRSFFEAKATKSKIAVITAYDYAMARLADSCDVDAILVGDSLGMVCLGYPDTLSVTMEDMLHHTKAVARGTQNALIVADLPFMSYQVSVLDAVKNSGRLIQEGRAHAVKLEGGADMLPQIEAIIKAQIPVMGHIGLTPQSINMMGGYRIQGRDERRAKELIEDAKKLEQGGVFAIVLECVPDELAKYISDTVSVPTIGIGAGNGCDGQVLVMHDMLGMIDEKAKKFVRVFKDAGMEIKRGISLYVEAVKNGSFPGSENMWHMDEKVIESLYGS